MRLRVVALATLMLVGQPLAKEATMQEAYKAVAFLAALSYECGDAAAIDNLRAIAEDDALETLEAGGYEPEEAISATETIFAALAENFEATGMPEAMCVSLAKQVLAGRAAFREKLRSN